VSLEEVVYRTGHIADCSRSSSFSVTGVILGGQTLGNVSNHKLPLQAAVVIVGILILVLSFFGYNVLHYWERYAWIVMLTFYM
jgi:purine-cytosine permease-like protein